MCKNICQRYNKRGGWITEKVDYRCRTYGGSGKLYSTNKAGGKQGG